MAGLVFAGCARFEEKPLAPAATADYLEGRSLGDTNFKAFLEKNLHRSFEEWPLTNVDFNTLALGAFYFHPSLDLARAQWSSARGGETTAGARPNPILGVAPGYSANPPKGVSPWFPSVTLDVPIETAGKRRYRISHAEHLSEAARLNISTAAWQIRKGVRLALLEYAVAWRRAELLREQVALRQRANDLLAQRLAAGAISAPEVSPSRLALIRLHGEMADANRLATEARVKIAGALGLPARAIAGLGFAFDWDQTPDPALVSAEARRAALLGRADLLAALAEYDATQSSLQLEIAKQYPDVHFNPGYQYDQGENKWQLGFSVELPVLYRNQGGIREASAKRDEAAARFLALQAKVISEIDHALAAYTSAVEQLKLVDELSRAQQQQVAQAEASFQAGASDQLDVANAHLEFAASALARLDALTARQQAVGLLEDALQRPFEGISTVERDPKLQATAEK